MPERTPTQAIERYVRPLQRALSCLTLAVLTAPDGYRAPNEPIALVVDRGRPVRLRGPGGIHLRVRIRARVTQLDALRGLWDAVTAAYEYRLSDQDDREILAYHWHPEGQSHVQTPHLHLGPAAEVGRISLLTAHLPTGSVILQDVLRLAIESFEVTPIRQDWDQVLRV